MIRDWEGGVPPASPMPTPTRNRASWAKLPAVAHSAVTALQVAMDSANTLRRDQRSARRATGIPNRA